MDIRPTHMHPLDCRRKCQKCRYDLCLSAGMDPEMVLNAEQKQFRFRNCLKKKMLKELEQQQHHPGHERDVRDEQERPRDAATPPSPLPPPPPMVPIIGGAYNGSRIAAFGTSMLSAFSKPPAPPIFAPSSPRREYEMPAAQERRPQPEYMSIEHSDERDLKISDVQLSYSQALDEVKLRTTQRIESSTHLMHSTFQSECRPAYESKSFHHFSAPCRRTSTSLCTRSTPATQPPSPSSTSPATSSGSRSTSPPSPSATAASSPSRPRTGPPSSARTPPSSSATPSPATSRPRPARTSYAGCSTPTRRRTSPAAASSASTAPSSTPAQRSSDPPTG